MQLNNGYLYQSRLKLFCIRIIDALLALTPKKKRKLQGHIRNILIIKSDHLGDMLNITSILPLIRKRYPEAIIDIVGNESSLSILNNNPHLRRRYIVNHYRANRLKKAFTFKVLEFVITFIKTARQVKREKYDIALILRAYGNNMIALAKIGGCRYIAGHKTGGWGYWLDEVAEWVPGKHEVEHHLEVLSLLDIKANIRNLENEIYCTTDEKIKVENAWSNSFSAEDKVAVIHPGAGNMRKSLTIDRWKYIAIILQKRGYQIAITGSLREKRLAEQIAPLAAKIYCGVFTPIELGLFFQKANLIVTVDSLSAHLCGLNKHKGISFYSGIDDIRQWRPIGENVVVIQQYCKKAPCYCGCKTMECLRFDLSVIDKTISQYL